MNGTARPPLSIALDTTFAGTNPTGVGHYSRRLAAQLQLLVSSENLALSCIGPSCADQVNSGVMATMQEWPVYTQAVVPMLLATHRSQIAHSTSHLGPLVTGARTIITVHDLLFLRYPADYNPLWLGVTKAMLPLLLKRAAAVVADSVATARDLGHFYRVPVRKIKVIYPGVDQYSVDMHGPPEQPPSVRSVLRGPYILCLGPWVGRKNVGVVVNAFEQIASRDEQIRLVITGSLPRGMKGEGPVSLVGRLPRRLRSRVHLTGYLPAEELREIVGGASVLTYPSRAEGFGLPPLEAMSRGVPVIAADTAVAREVYGQAAVYAPPDEPGAWAHCLERVLTDEALRAKLRAEGCVRSAEFTWEKCALECVALYRGVHAVRGRG